MTMLRKITLTAIGCASIFFGVAADIFDSHGCAVRISENEKVIWPVFSADSAFEGAPEALDAMECRGIKGSFFFTGNFLRDTAHRTIINRVIKGGHYVGPHSDGHLLYADWDRQRTVLVSSDSLLDDMRHNLAELARAGVDTSCVKIIMPPFEWIERSQTALLHDSLGLKVINPTPGLEVYRDYTTPDMSYYWSSERLLSQMYEFERKEGLNGVVFIMHLGTHPSRTDKFYRHLPEILDSLTSLGYRFERLP
ncbi:MAG: hypothetical protein K2M19_07840 [Muribaculaceae bacterium]|nr:hypothetical protein [Muribaculaceae bacterium]